MELKDQVGRAQMTQLYLSHPEMRGDVAVSEGFLEH